ncbi:hypothetical protein A2U01_0070477, partial [Trifolium medium]|nr:hypothetical protein [Trifolium medium]
RYLTLKGTPPNHGSDQNKVSTPFPTLLSIPFANHPRRPLISLAIPYSSNLPPPRGTSPPPTDNLPATSPYRAASTKR